MRSQVQPLQPVPDVASPEPAEPESESETEAAAEAKPEAATVGWSMHPG